ALEHQWRSHAMADGNRQGLKPSRGAHPGSPRPVGTLTTIAERSAPARFRQGLSFWLAPRRAQKCWSSIATNGATGASAQKTYQGVFMRHLASAIFLTTALTLSTGAQAQAPQGYPADYAQIVD